MASKPYDLRKYSYKPSSSMRPDAALTSSSTDAPAATPLQSEETAKMDVEALKNDILLSLKADIAQDQNEELSADVKRLFEEYNKMMFLLSKQFTQWDETLRKLEAPKQVQLTD